MHELLTVQTSAADVVLFTVTRRLLYAFLRPIRYSAGSIRVSNGRLTAIQSVIFFQFDDVCDLPFFHCFFVSVYSILMFD